jgi:ferredoxin
MMVTKIDPDFKPDPAVLARFPEMSGNEVNGLGERVARQPSCFFWHPPDRQTHGELREFVMQRFVSARDGGRDRGDVGDRGPEPVVVSPIVKNGTAEQFTEMTRDFALANESDLTGVAELDPHWVYDGYEVAERYVIALGLAQDYEMMKHAPPGPGNHYSNTEVRRQYNRGARAARKLANYIRESGFNATAHHGPDAEALLMIPAAEAAGLGELGKHGSLINRRYGSNFRLAAVTTDMDRFGADGFCENCNVCTDACPPDAIMKSKQTVRGEVKWYVDFDKCIPYFAERLGCALCMVVCPWSRPGVADKLVDKFARRADVTENREH